MMVQEGEEEQIGAEVDVRIQGEKGEADHNIIFLLKSHKQLDKYGVEIRHISYSD